MRVVEATNRETLIAGRIKHVQAICQTSIEHDRPRETGPNDWTDRHWLAQSVLNILGGAIDAQIEEEAARGSVDV